MELASVLGLLTMDNNMTDKQKNPPFFFTLINFDNKNELFLEPRALKRMLYLLDELLLNQQVLITGKKTVVEKRMYRQPYLSFGR